MIKEAIDRIIELTNPPTFMVDDRVYHYDSGRGLDAPRVSSIGELGTLSGFVSYLKSPEGKTIGPDKAQIVVDSYNHVGLVSVPTGDWFKRCEYITAKSEIEKFPFGKYMDRELFAIKAQCLFVESPKKDELISHVSSIVDEQSVKTDDDGISQTVVAKSGFRNVEKKMSPIITLRPYRTFPDVEQPASKFLVRLKKGCDGTEVALFEADGGHWKVQACATIAQWLCNNDCVKDHNLKVIG